MKSSPTSISGSSIHNLAVGDHYSRLVEQESHHWGIVRHDLQNPQMWDDPRLFEIFFGKEYRHLIELVVSSGFSVLELGCGEGNLSILLAKRGLFVTAIDLSKERIMRAISKAQNENVDHRITFVEGDLNTLALNEDSYDCIVAHDSLHHILQLGRLMDQSRVALKPGGRLIVQDYSGMGRPRKLVASLLFAVLPTFQSYRAKWKLRSRFKAFLATERQKRLALQNPSSSIIRQDSPFEEISGESIIQEIVGRFDVVEFRTFNPFWFYLAPKLKLRSPFRYWIATLFRSLDDFLVKSHLSRGAYFLLEAKRPN
jgi:ubiquinone/menaquinone biosynthesis C-methylase UbiE